MQCEYVIESLNPQCRCFITYVLKTDEEHRRDIMTDTNGDSVNTVKDVPDSFKQWVKDNGQRIKASEQKGTLPYFLKDNEKYWKEGSGGTNSLHSNTGANSITENGYRKGNFVEIDKDTAKEKLMSLGERATHEEAYVMLTDGRVLHKTSDVLKITFDNDELKLLYGASILHSHPYGTLSDRDLVTALKNRASSISAITREYEYKASFTDEVYEKINGKDVRALFEESVIELNSEMKKMDSRMFDYYLSNMQEMEIRHFCKKIGAIYNVIAL